jgi:hypothetical protein
MKRFDCGENLTRHGRRVNEEGYSPALNKAATLRFGLILADKPGLATTVLELASQEAALA